MVNYMEQNFYVYYLINPLNCQVFYVGKGKDDRMLTHEKIALKKWKETQTEKLKPHHLLIQELHAQGLKIIYEKVLINVSEKQALTKEKQLIEYHGRIINGTGYLLNISPGGSNGGKTEKPVNQYTLEGELVETFSSAKQASEKVSTANQSYITQCCKGKRVSSGGFLWSYKDNSAPVFHKQYYRKVGKYTKDNILLTVYTSITEAGKDNNIKFRNISTCCRGKSTTSGGYKWSYLD